MYIYIYIYIYLFIFCWEAPRPAQGGLSSSPNPTTAIGRRLALRIALRRSMSLCVFIVCHRGRL